MSIRRPQRVPRAMAAMALILVGTGVHAQERGTIRGTVSDASGQPIEGAQISIPERQLGSLSRATGAYLLTGVPAGTHEVQATILGFGTQTQSVQLTAGGIVQADFRLEQTALALEGIVVTALGISREERALGYAVDNIQEDQISEIPTENISASLAGKAAGLQVKSLGPIGGSSSVVLRGFSSISGSNQVLFIVDGVPVNNESVAECNANCGGRSGSSWYSGAFGEGGVDYGNAVQDLNPQDIESISVLKGANAAALYGSRASNGVVLITTKKGAGVSGFRLDASVQSMWSTPLAMPTYQNRYGGGPRPDQGYQWVDGEGTGIGDGTDESWGPPLDGQLYDQWFSPDPQPWLASPYSPRTFWRTGHNHTFSAAAAASTDRSNIRFGATQMEAAGITPASELDRTNLSLAGVVELTDALRLTGAANYNKTVGENRPSFRSSLFSVGYAFSYWQRQVDIDRLRNAWLRWRETGEYPRSGHRDGWVPGWNHNYFDSPFYYQGERYTSDVRDRGFGHVQLEYDVNEWLSARARVGSDWYSHRIKEEYPISEAKPEGGFKTGKNFRQETNAELLLSGTFELGGNFGMSVRTGGNLRWNDADSHRLETSFLNVPGIYNAANSAVPPTINDFVSKKEVHSLYGLASMNWGSAVFVDVTARNDWSSTLPAENNSYFYPSFSSSWIFTETMELPEFLSFGKLRASWAKVGSDAQPYQLLSTANQASFWGSTPSFTQADEIANSGLRPEETISIEIGTELRFANDRATLDLTYYKSNTSDQILPVDISQATGYTRQILNAGEVENRGVEIVLSGDILRNPNGLNWRVETNFAKNTNEVISLTQGLDRILLGDFRGLSVMASVGDEYGAFYGQTFSRDSQGRILVGNDGRPIATEEKQHLGNFQPDWLAGIRNSFRYRDLNVSFLIDIRQGGDVYCHTCMIGWRTGQLIETLEGREQFGLVHEGVLPDGSPNNVMLTLNQYQRARYNMFEVGIFDASFIKLREISVGFDLPEDILSKLPLSTARFSLIGRDLLSFHDVPHIDPEISSTSGNYQGLETYLLPTSRSFGFSLKVTR